MVYLGYATALCIGLSKVWETTSLDAPHICLTMILILFVVGRAIVNTLSFSSRRCPGPDLWIDAAGRWYYGCRSVDALVRGDVETAGWYELSYCGYLVVNEAEALIGRWSQGVNPEWPKVSGCLRCHYFPPFGIPELLPSIDPWPLLDLRLRTLSDTSRSKSVYHPSWTRCSPFGRFLPHFLPSSATPSMNYIWKGIPVVYEVSVVVRSWIRCRFRQSLASVKSRSNRTNRWCWETTSNVSSLGIHHQGTPWWCRCGQFPLPCYLDTCREKKSEVS